MNKILTVDSSVLYELAGVDRIVNTIQEGNGRTEAGYTVSKVCTKSLRLLT